MRIACRSLLVVLGLLGVGLSTAEAGGWAIGVRIGGPVYCGPRWYGGYYYGYPYYPYAVIAPPATIYVQSAPTPVVQSVQPAPAPAVQNMQPELAPAPALAASPAENRTEVDARLRQLADADEGVRSEAALQLGRFGAQRAIDPLAATLAGDRSPHVREAAARALGLVGSVKGLTALKSAAQSDSDRDVRKSAQFSIEVIQATLRR